jgi:hypothetical protein
MISSHVTIVPAAASMWRVRRRAITLIWGSRWKSVFSSVRNLARVQVLIG